MQKLCFLNKIGSFCNDNKKVMWTDVMNTIFYWLWILSTVCININVAIKLINISVSCNVKVLISRQTTFCSLDHFRNISKALFTIDLRLKNKSFSFKYLAKAEAPYQSVSQKKTDDCVIETWHVPFEDELKWPEDDDRDLALTGFVLSTFLHSTSTSMVIFYAII